LLYDLKLSGHREERFLIKMECQDQQVKYTPVMTNIKGCGFFFPFPVPSDGVMYSMKIAAILSRQKGRDFYDTIFLSSQTKPDYDFLAQRCGIKNITELKSALMEMLSNVNLPQKARDFEHLLFETRNGSRILGFKDFVETL
jgi:hypothetical protein